MPASVTPPLRAVLAGHAMHSPIVAAPPGCSLAEVAALMSSVRIHCVLVDGIARDASGEHLVWGVLSDMDLLRGAIAADPSATAATLAGTPAVTVDVTDDLVTVAAALVEADCAHAVVVRDGRPAGVISTLDIASVLGR